MMGSAAGKYRLGACLGTGGMAEVFAGDALGAEGFVRPVAIKRVLPGLSEVPEFARMFTNEAQLGARLVHPNIVAVLDFDRDKQQRLFMVMELVDGLDLAALAGSGALPCAVAIHIVCEVLRGLGHAHDLLLSSGGRGIVHRDISLKNVLIAWDGAVKISDFGVAQARHATAVTASMSHVGKPAYASPEQVRGEALDGRSDLFSVGVMLWELLVGRGLFVAEDERGTLAAVLFADVPRPRMYRAVPRDLDQITMKLLARDRASRYQTAAAAIADLQACPAARGGREQLRVALDQRRGIVDGGPELARDADPRTAIPKKRRRWLLVAPLGLLLAAAMVAAFAVATPHGEEHAPPDAPLVERDLVGPAGLDLPRACTVLLGRYKVMVDCVVLSEWERVHWAETRRQLLDHLVEWVSTRDWLSLATSQCQSRLFAMRYDQVCVDWSTVGPKATWASCEPYLRSLQKLASCPKADREFRDRVKEYERTVKLGSHLYLPSGPWMADNPRDYERICRDITPIRVPSGC